MKQHDSRNREAGAPTPDPARRVLAKRCANSMEAAFLKGYLEDNGIPAWDGRETERAWTGRYGAISRGARLTVRASDYARAKPLLATPPPPPSYAEDEPDAPKESFVLPEDGTPLERCPNCGSENIELLESSPLWRWATGLILLGIPFFLRSGPRSTYICRDCDWDSLRSR